MKAREGKKSVSEQLFPARVMFVFFPLMPLCDVPGCALAQAWDGAGALQRQMQPVTHGNTHGVSICHANYFLSMVFNTRNNI